MFIISNLNSFAKGKELTQMLRIFPVKPNSLPLNGFKGINIPYNSSFYKNVKIFSEKINPIFKVFAMLTLKKNHIKE